MRRFVLLGAVLIGLSGCVSEGPIYGGYDPYPDIYEPDPVIVYSDRYRRPPIYRDYRPAYRDRYYGGYREPYRDRRAYRRPVYDRPDYRPEPPRRDRPRREDRPRAEAAAPVAQPDIQVVKPRLGMGTYNGPGPRAQRPRPYRPPILNSTK